MATLGDLSFPPFPRESPKAIPGEMGDRLGESSYVNRLSESFATEGCDCNHMSRTL